MLFSLILGLLASGDNSGTKTYILYNIFYSIALLQVVPFCCKTCTESCVNILLVKAGKNWAFGAAPYIWYKILCSLYSLVGTIACYVCLGPVTGALVLAYFLITTPML